VFAYWAQFACGIAAYYLITGRRRWAFTPWCILSTVGVTALSGLSQNLSFLEADGRLSLGLKLVFCLTAAALLVVLYPYDERLTRSRWIQGFSALGLISYSVYLTHEPIGTRIFNLGERLTGLNGPWWLVYAASALIMAVALGAVFFRLCERPWLNTESTRSPEPAPIHTASLPALECVQE
jgi:peptidoglycan/LPS O-acetylase OafA/YrhL